MSEPVKYSYKSFGGFFFFLGLIFLLLLGSGSILIGIFVTIFSWAPIASPDLLTTYRITILSQRINDPAFAFTLFLLTGSTLIAVGTIIIGFTHYLYRVGQAVDQDLSKIVDQALPSIKVFFSRKGKAVFIMAIMLFGAFMVLIDILTP